MDSTFTRSRRLGILFIVAVAVGIPPISALAQPAHDDCANAICVEDGVAFEGSTVGATGTDVTTCSPEDDLDVWHTYKPEVSGNVTITLCDSGYDTSLAVFDACDGAQLACDDDGCTNPPGSNRSLLTKVGLAEGETYLIRVSGYFGATGPYTLLVTGGGGTCGVPSNDECSGAIPVTCGELVPGSTQEATEDGAPDCGLMTSAPGVWYSIVGDGSFITVDTCSPATEYDTQIRVYQDGCGTLTCVGANDDACPEFRSEFSWLSEPGVEYLILVDGFRGDRGQFELFFSCTSGDECSDCHPVGDGTFNGTTLDNSGSTGDDTSCGANDTIDEWYCYTASCTGTATASLCGSAFNTTLAVFDACGGAELACEDDSCGLQSEVEWEVAAGVTYNVRISGVAESGDYSLTLDCTPEGLENDDCEDATPIGDGNFPYSNIGANTDGPEHADCFTTDDHQNNSDIWYLYTAPQAASEVIVSTCDSADYDTKLAVYRGSECPVDDARLIVCNDDAIQCKIRMTSEVSFAAGCGEQYLIRVGGWDGNPEGNGTLRVSSTPTTNDDCADATAIAEGTFGFSNCGATTDGPDEPGDCNFSNYTHLESDIWYRYTSSCTGDVTVSLCGSQYDTKLAVYGANCPADPGEVIVCNEDACSRQSEVTFAAAASDEFLIRIGGFEGEQGVGTMNVSVEVVDVPGDTDCDGDVDLDDYEAFQQCFRGPGNFPGISCLSLDFDNDRDVDLHDWRVFQTLFTG